MNYKLTMYIDQLNGGMIWVQTFAVLFRFGHWKHLQCLKKSDRLRLTPMHYYPANVVSQINDILIKFEAT